MYGAAGSVLLSFHSILVTLKLLVFFGLFMCWITHNGPEGHYSKSLITVDKIKNRILEKKKKRSGAVFKADVITQRVLVVALCHQV